MKKTRHTKNICIALLIFFTLSQQANAALLYAVQQGNSFIITVDSVTGATAAVGMLPLGSDTDDPVQGLTGTSWGTLLYTDGNALGGVHELDPTDATVINSYSDGGTIDRGGLSFDSASGQLFSVNNGDPVASQAGLGGAVDFAFAPGILPDIPGAIGGDDNGRQFSQAFIPGGGEILEFDIMGNPLNSLPLPNGELPSGLAFDGQHLYASSLDSNLLYTLDPDDGSIINSVSYFGVGGESLTALAVLPVPVPAALWLFFSGLIGLVGFKRKVRV